MISASPAVYRRSDRVDETRVGDRIVLYQRDRGTAIILNPAGSSVWDALSQPLSSGQIVAGLLSRFGSVSRERVEADVDAYLSSLMAEELISIRQ